MTNYAKIIIYSIFVLSAFRATASPPCGTLPPFSSTSTDPTDCGANDGTITILANDNTLEYSIDSGATWQTDSVFIALMEGTYHLAIRDAADPTCADTSGIVNLVGPTPPVIGSVSSTDPTDCGINNGTITIQANSSIGNALEYSIDGGGNWFSFGNFTGLNSGNYNVVVRNADGTCLIFNTNNPVTLTAPTAPNINNVISTNPTDCGINDGTITIQANSSIGNALEYSIDGAINWQAANTFNNLLGGNYNIVVRNVDGTCEIFSPNNPVTLTAPVAPTFGSVSSTDPTDCGVNDGTITVQANSSIGNALEYSNDGGGAWQAGNIFTNLNGGSYSIRVRNIDGSCVINGGTVILNNKTPPTITSIFSTDPTTCSLNNGTITITASGSGALEYSIDGGTNWQFSNSFTILPSGSYNAAVRNNDGTCLILNTSNPIILTAPTAPSITNVSSTDPTDCGVTDGTITITAAGGSGSYQYAIDGGTAWQATGNFSNLTGNTYSIRVRNADGTCIVSSTDVILTDKIQPTISSVTSADPTDCGLADGTITITASGSGGLEYSIDGGFNWQANNSFIGLPSGTYNVVVRNNDGTCSVLDTGNPITLTAPSAPSITNVNFTDLTNCSASDGTITITASGSVALEYSIDNGTTWQATGNFSGLSDKTYFTQIRNIDETCIVAGPIVVLELSPPVISSVTSADPTDCTTASDGTITITASGSGGLEYSINGGGSWFPTGNFSNLICGTYQIRVRNTDGTCIVSSSDVTLPASVITCDTEVSSVSKSDVFSCVSDNGSIEITATGGSGIYEYSIDSGSTYQSGNIFNSLSAGDYYVFIRTDDGSCDTAFVNNPITIVDSAAILNIVNDTIKGVSLTCINSDICIDIPFSDYSNYQLFVDGSAYTGAAFGCNNDTIFAYFLGAVFNGGVGPYLFSWSKNGTPFNATIQNFQEATDSMNSWDNTGNWFFDASGSTIEGGNTGNTYGNMEFTHISTNSFSSASPNTALSAQGSQINLASSDEVLIITANSSGCSDTTQIEINCAPTAVTDSFSVTTNTLYQNNILSNDTDPNANDALQLITQPVIDVQNGTLTLHSNGIFEYTSNPLFVGVDSFYYEIKDNGFGFLGDTGRVFINVLLIIPNNPPIAVNDTIGTTAGSSVSGFALNNDSDPDFNSIFINIIPVQNPTKGTVTINNNGSYLYTPNSGFYGVDSFQYQICDNGTPILCDTATVIINVICDIDILSINANNWTDCNSVDGTINISASTNTGNLSYSIDSGSTYQVNAFFNSLDSGIYYIFIKNNNSQCVENGGSIFINSKVAPTILNVITTNPTDCGLADGTIIIQSNSSIGNALEYSINGGTTWFTFGNFLGLSGGTYQIRVRNGDGTCEISSSDATLVDKISPVINNVTLNNPTNCSINDGAITITATGNSLEYSIDGGINWLNNNNFTGLSSGNYNVLVRNDDGTCLTFYVNNPITLTAPTAPTINNIASANPTNCGVADGTITITASNGSGNYQYSIDSGTTWQAGNTFTGLNGGSYSILTRNSDGTCEVNGGTLTLTDKVAPIITNVTSTNPTDCGTNDGTITIQANSPAGNALEYSIDGGNSWFTFGNFTGLNGGITYQIRVRNGDGTCQISSSDVTLNNKIPPVITFVNSTSPSSCSSNSATITINATGFGIEYSIDGGINWQGNNFFNNLPSGTYNIAVRNNDGNCQVLDVSNPLVITSAAAPNITSETSTEPTDCNVNDGTITINAAGGVSGNYHYSIDGGIIWQIGNTFSNLAGGNYPIRIRNDDQTCPITGSIIILTNKVTPTITSVNSSNPTDCSSSNGSIDIQANSSAGNNLEYSIDAGTNWQPSNLFINLGCGTYPIRVRNADNSCEITASDVVISGNNPPTITTSTIHSILENTLFVTIVQATDNDANDTITFNLIGGVDSSFFTLNSLTGLLMFNNPPDYENPQDDNGDNVYLVEISATDLAENRDTATFSISILDSNDGTGTPIFTMTTDTLRTIEGYLNAATILAQDPDSNDVFYFNIIGGLDSQFFDIDTVTGILSFNNLPVFDTPLDNNGDNIYEIRLQVRDTSGGSSNQLFYISVISCKSVYQIDSIFKNNVTICDASNGLISVFSNENTPRPVRYSVDGGLNWQNQNLFFNQPAGSYPIFIKSNDDVCIIKGDTVIINGLTSPIVDSISTIHTNCNDSTGQIQVHATGDFEYSINAGISWQADSTFIDLAGNNYFIAIRNADSTCQNLPLTQNPVSIQIAPTPAIAQFLATDPTDCGLSDGIISMSAINGNGSYLYSIDSGQTFSPNNIFNNLAGDSTYYLVLANADTTCQIQGATISMVNKILPIIDSVPSFSSISDCNLSTPNGSITVYASGNGALQYSANAGTTWQPSNIFINLNAGNYPIFIRNFDGSCELDANININITTPQPPIINGIFTINNTDCDSTNGTITVNATAQSTQPIEYSINGGANYQASNVFSNLSANSNYNIAVRYTDGSCEVGYLNNPVVITQPMSPLIQDIDPMNPSDCGLSDGSIYLTASGGLAPLQYGISTANGIQWQSNGFFSNLSSKTYTVYVRNADSTCQVASVPILIDTLQAVLLFAPINFVSPTNCANNDGSITIFATTGDSTDNLEYSIDNGVLWQSNHVFDSLWAGVYDIIVRSNGSCESTPFNYQLLPTANQFIQNIQTKPPTDCGEQDAEIRIIPVSGLGNLQYSIDSGLTWSTSALFMGLHSGSYSVGVRAINGLFGCEEYRNVVIITPILGDAEILEIVDVSCFGARDGSAKIRFDYPTGSQIINITGLQSGEQIVQSDSLLGCQDSVTIVINEPPPLEIRLLETPTSDGVLGSINSIVNGGTLPYSYKWSNGVTTDSRILNLEVGNYSVTVTDNNGCTITDNATIKERNSQVFNTITPNGDGINDVLFFGKIANNVCKESELIVMNRWGQIVYESGKTVYNNDWNGVDNQGKPLPNGAYLYVFRCDLRLEKRSLMILR